MTIAESLHRFINHMLHQLQHHPLWLHASENEWQGTGEGLEKFIMTKIWQRCVKGEFGRRRLVGRRVNLDDSFSIMMGWRS